LLLDLVCLSTLLSENKALTCLLESPLSPDLLYNCCGLFQNLRVILTGLRNDDTYAHIAHAKDHLFGNLNIFSTRMLQKWLSDVVSKAIHQIYRDDETVRYRSIPLIDTFLESRNFAAIHAMLSVSSNTGAANTFDLGRVLLEEGKSSLALQHLLSVEMKLTGEGSGSDVFLNGPWMKFTASNIIRSEDPAVLYYALLLKMLATHPVERVSVARAAIQASPRIQYFWDALLDAACTASDKDGL
jgi:hypothetical protein